MSKDKEEDILFQQWEESHHCARDSPFDAFLGGLDVGLVKGREEAILAINLRIEMCEDDIEGCDAEELERIHHSINVLDALKEQLNQLRAPKS